MTRTQKSLAPVGAGQGSKSKQSQHQHYNTNDALDQFRATVTIAGIVLPDHFPVGEIVRCDVMGKKPGNKAASVCLFLDGYPAGWFENFTDGLGPRKWRYSPEGSTPPPIDFDHKAHEAKLKAQREHLEKARQHKQEQAAQKARYQYGGATGNVNHPYLTQKQIQHHGCRQSGEVLLIPIINTDLKLVNLQRIYPDGSKRFLPGGQIKGCFSPIGRVNPLGVIYVCEGFATGASIHESTGNPVACAMNAGNLLPVASYVRTTYSRATIVIAGDDDKNTPNNPGRTKANETAAAINGLVTFPEFCSPDCSCTDFNDVALCRSRNNGGGS